MQEHGAWYLILWEFYAKDGLEKRFEQVYGPRGKWARFFAQDKGYRGTELHRDVQKNGRYVSPDYWASQGAYETFRQQHLAEYQEIDRQCESPTDREILLGSFLSVGPPRPIRRGL
ncbi:MAG: hypothetical protein HY237_12465 [Acidobacteria bacterium]|nr:hypothetical protein [Acidobacteriota bacterium]